MKNIPRSFKALMAASMVVVLQGCKSSDSGTSTVSGSMYDDPFLDAWYYGDYCDDGDIIVTPPDRPTDPKPTHPIVLPPDAPPKPAQPIASTPMPRPTPMPSIPRMPMPRVRAR